MNLTVALALVIVLAAIIFALIAIFHPDAAAAGMLLIPLLKSAGISSISLL